MRRYDHRFTLACITAAQAFVAAGVASGQEVRYRVTDVVTLGAGFNLGEHDTIAINNVGAVVGGYHVGPEIHGFVWLPDPLYGLTAGFHDLNDLANLQGHSALYDINLAGVAAGRAGSLLWEQEGGQAKVWDIAAPGVPLCPIATLAGGMWNVAWAISDTNLVAGDSQTDLGECDLVTWGFQINVGFADPGGCLYGPLVPLPPLAGDNTSYSRDVNTPADPREDAKIVGFSREGDFPPLCISPFFECDPQKDGVEWKGAFPIILTQLVDLSVNGAEGRGNNDADQIAGWRFNSADPCLIEALFWQSADDADPDNLNLALPPGEESVAEAVNNPDQTGRVEVVGTNTTTERAHVWEGDPSTSQWTATPLNDLIGPCADNWTLVQARDINDEDVPWIVGWGLFQGQIHGFVLRPIETCVGDLNGDWCVNSADLTILLGAWAAGTAAGDLDCDGDTDSADLTLLLGAWAAGECVGQCGGQGPQGGGSGPAALESALAVMGFADVADFQAHMSAVSDAEAFACGCVLEVLLSTQP